MLGSIVSGNGVGIVVGMLTWNEHILVWSSYELHGFLRENSHVLVDCVA